MPRMGGIELLDAIGTAAPDALTVIMTGFGTVETAIDAMKRGAYDYILKPFKVEEVIHVVQRGIEKQRLAAENLRLREAALALQGERSHRREPLARRGARDRRRQPRSTRSSGDLVSTWLDDGEGGFFERQHPRRRPTPEGSPDREPRPVESRSSVASWRARATIEHYALRPCSSRATEGRALLRRPAFRAARVARRGAAADEDSACSASIGVAASPSNKRFNEGHRKLLSIVGSRAAAAIENARLYEDLHATFQQTIQGLARGHRQDGPLHRGPLGARRRSTRRYLAASSGSRPTSSRSCGRAR